MGAMENAGAVTFTEVYVFRAKVTEAIVERRALTILHELAHMWFGDLVTMQWWNDLWLNESFAEWASTHRARPRPPSGPSAWTTFGTSEKAWAYRQDQLSSTHPIVADIRDLEDVEVNFDGITYAKGASVLKQLVAYVGREPFVAGLRAYFAKHAWGNTTLADLLAELEQTSGRDLSTWSQAVAGDRRGQHAAARGRRSTTHGVITAAAITQTARRGLPDAAPAPPRRRPVRRAGRRSWCARDRLELDVDGERTEVPELVGRRAARPAAGQRRRPRLRQDPPRRALARHGRGPPARLRRQSCPARWCSARRGT